MVVLLDQRLSFPDPRRARADGLVAIGGDLSVERLGSTLPAGGHIELTDMHPGETGRGGVSGLTSTA